MTGSHDGVKVDPGRNCSSIWVLSILRSQLVKDALVVKRAMLLLEGLLLFKHLVKLIIRIGIANGFETRANVVLFVEPGRARVRRSTIHAFLSFCCLVVGTDHLLVEKLVGDTRQTVLLFLFLLHLSVLDHVEETAVQDDLSLRVITVTLHPECLNLAFVLQTME